MRNKRGSRQMDHAKTTKKANNEKTSKRGSSESARKIRHATKIYSETDVLTANEKRFEIIFNEFDNVVFTVSGGKDSGVTVQMGNRIAEKLHKKFAIIYVDLEAMYEETERFVKSIREITRPNCTNFYWVCLPLCEDNACSALNPQFLTWDESAKEKWIRPIPEGAITTANNPFPFYENLMDFNKFMEAFAIWSHETTKAQRTGVIVGIRTDESLRRFMAVANNEKPTYKNYKWSTEFEPNIYNLYPIYDWKVEDVWGAVAKFDFDYNRVYEAMYKNGVPLSKQRICQPFGMAQKAGLDQFRVIEPETWEKLLQRVEGVNFGAIYCRTSLFGQITSMKPPHLTWQQYTVFLLESLGLYQPKIMRRYYEKMKYYMLWCQKNENMPYGVLPEESRGRNASWKRMAKAIERNDFYLSYLEFGPDKQGDQLLIELHKEHRLPLQGDGQLQPKIQKRLQKIEAEQDLA